MISKPIILIWGEPNSIFSEILVKSLHKYKNKRPIILIGSKKLLISQLRKLRLNLNFVEINHKNYKFKKIYKNKLNILNVNYDFKSSFEKISSKSNSYIQKSFSEALNIINKNKISGVINGPISKKFFLGKKFQGITEYFAKRLKINKKFCMLIFNKSLSVVPITTHLPINKVSANLDKKSIFLKTILIFNFYKKYFNKNPKIAICGLNPHCENFISKSEEKNIIIPAINSLKKKKVYVSGPFPADTIFMRENRKKFDVIVGMYHDQVLSPIKTIYGFSAINITLGLPILRLSPDHGPNFGMIGKNKSNAQSLLEAIKFLDKVK